MTTQATPTVRVPSPPQTKLDLSLDVATLLRQGTLDAHEAAENSAGAISLVRGELDKIEYIRFLVILWHIYATLEDAIEQHASFPVLAPSYNPALLARAPALSSDIAHLLSVPESEWKSHPLALSVTQMPPLPLSAYIQRIRSISSSPDPTGLLAHAYVRYLGDLSGGQVIRHRVSKAYGLDLQSGIGTQFYEFQKLGGGGVADKGDMRAIKSWYRNGMNKGVGEDEKRKLVLIAEAVTAFQLNAGIFASLRPPSQQSSTHSDIDASLKAEPADRNLTIAGVVSFLLAMGIAHFALVTGGFLGDDGLQKWDRARDWIRQALGAA